MYHPGKVIEVFRPSDKDVKASDSSVQATLRMWDENILTLTVAPKIIAALKRGDIVLVDYRPDPNHKAPTPSHIVSKIIQGKKADAAWNAYRDMYERQQKRQGAREAQSYIA
jgi:hypothetical protein